ncbi:TIGR02444 family protein (plasmid) [Rhizobium jaguaris]|uniref:TIGR02444 family protein n=2 Tax=Rhizobium jaguaris TaxID=1312183 RepID=A0A387FWM3_9HYPH|nr:TIGR02444 family protein [Rhizobium jaguaris]
MPMPGPDLWNFSVSLYEATGVSDACLSLQDESDLDVPVLLFAAWLGTRSVPLPADDLERIAKSVDAWREEVVVPLRTLRKRLKTGPAPAPCKRTEALRNTIKGAELSAERIELYVLEAEGLALVKADGANPLENMAVAVRHYRGGDISERASSLIETIAKALPLQGRPPQIS